MKRFMFCHVLIWAGATIGLANAQTFSHENGVLWQSSDILTGQVAFGFNKGQSKYHLRQKGSFLRESWHLKTPDTSLLITPANAWGFRSGGRTYRFGRSGSFELVHQGVICLYRTSSSRSNHYYFSRDLESPIFWLTPRKLKREYADNAAVQKAVHELRWHQAPDDQLDRSGLLRILTWFPEEITARND